MAWSDDDYITSFDTEAGDISTLATSAQKILWFNEAQERLLRRRQDFTDITWVSDQRSVDIPADFVSLAHVVFNTSSSIEAWRVWGQTLIITDPDGAGGDGGAKVYYYSEYAPMTTPGLGVTVLAGLCLLEIRRLFSDNGIMRPDSDDGPRDADKASPGAATPGLAVGRVRWESIVAHQAVNIASFYIGACRLI